MKRKCEEETEYSKVFLWRKKKKKKITRGYVTLGEAESKICEYNVMSITKVLKKLKRNIVALENIGRRYFFLLGGGRKKKREEKNRHPSCNSKR